MSDCLDDEAAERLRILAVGSPRQIAELLRLNPAVQLQVLMSPEAELAEPVVDEASVDSVAAFLGIRKPKE